MADQGRARQVRLTRNNVTSRIRKMRSTFDAGAIRQLAKLRGELDANQRSAILEEVTRVKDMLAKVVRALR